jgi:hypothetical protein
MRLQPDGSSSVMFDGLADNIAIDAINNTASVIGRDYSSVLIGSTFQDSFCNQTASDIASSIAARHGLVPNISPTPTMIGSYQCDGYNQVLLNEHSPIKSEWELLKYIARAEGFELFVDGTTLVFAAAKDLPRNAVTIGVGDVTGLTFHRICPTSAQTTLTAKSWNSWLAQAFSHTDDHSTDQSAFGLPALSPEPGTEISMVKPNLTPRDTERLVNQRLNAMIELATTVQIAMPGEMSLMPGDILSIISGNTSFDADYVIGSVRRRFSPAAGFVQYIHGSTLAVNLPASGGTDLSPNG